MSVGEILHARITDSELLDLRVAAVRDEVIAPLQTDASLNSWQAATIETMSRDLSADQTIDLPTRTGKSHLIRMIAASAAKNGVRTLIVSPRKHILNEHFEGLEELGAQVDYLSPVEDQSQETPVQIASTQSIARANGLVQDQFDLVIVDEGHKAIGQKTTSQMRQYFPNAVRVALTATPDYAENRSVVGEYGDKLISRSVREAIEEDLVSPVRAFLYKTEAVIDNYDPNLPDFTPRELRRIASLVARNNAIVDTAHDLIKTGRQGLITTIPGENLLHADILKQKLVERTIEQADGTTRYVRAQVVRGSDKNIAERLQDFEDGAIDVLFYCDMLREGMTSRKASFLINGRPTTSIVNLTQDIGRILQKKDLESIVVDFVDESVKHQRTVYDVLELDRSVQGILVASDSVTEATDGSGHSDTYLRGLFRPSLVDAFQKYNNRLLATLVYQPQEPKTPYQLRLERHQVDQAREFARQTKTWEKVLAKEGLAPEPIDVFTATPSFLKASKYATDNEDGTFSIDNRRSYYDRTWDISDAASLIVPGEPYDPQEMAEWEIAAEDFGRLSDPAELVIHSRQLARVAIARAMQYLYDPRSADMLVRRFGLDDDEAKTLEEVGNKYGVTRERIRHIEARALAEMRHPKRVDELLGHLPTSLVYGAIERPMKDEILQAKPIKSVKPARDLAVAELPPLSSSTADIAANQRQMAARDRLFKGFEQVLGVRTRYLIRDEQEVIDVANALLHRLGEKAGETNFVKREITLNRILANSQREKKSKQFTELINDLIARNRKSHPHHYYQPRLTFSRVQELLEQAPHYKEDVYNLFGQRPPIE